jgi:hypothetical protein
VKDTSGQLSLPGVPLGGATQGREVPARWGWTEASVWTERMLATLERGIKGGQWALAQRLLRGLWINLLSLNPQKSGQCSQNPLTGEPYAGKPPVRFGGRGGVVRHPYPYQSDERWHVEPVGPVPSPGGCDRAYECVHDAGWGHPAYNPMNVCTLNL